MKIKRDIIDDFKRWKNNPHRKPILLTGSRQVGKTWAMHEFGNEYFDHCAIFDFDRHPELKSVFQTSKDPTRIVKELELAVAFLCDMVGDFINEALVLALVGVKHGPADGSHDFLLIETHNSSVSFYNSLNH